MSSLDDDDDNKPARENLYVQGLPAHIQDTQVKEVFKQYGEVAWCRLLKKIPGKPDCVALIRMKLQKDAEWLVDNLHGNIPAGLDRALKVSFSPQNDLKAQVGAPPPEQLDQYKKELIPVFQMIPGIVRRWDEVKGFGFIGPEIGGPDVFAHRQELEDGEILINGMRVMFEAVPDTAKGPGKYRARAVRGATSREEASQIASQQVGNDRLYVVGLPLDIQEEALRMIFQQYGQVVSVKKLSPHGTKQVCSGIIQMGDAKVAKWLTENLDGKIPSGMTQPVEVRYAEFKGQQNPGAANSYLGIQCQAAPSDKFTLHPPNRPNLTNETFTGINKPHTETVGAGGFRPVSGYQPPSAGQGPYGGGFHDQQIQQQQQSRPLTDNQQQVQSTLPSQTRQHQSKWDQTPAHLELQQSQIQQPSQAHHSK